MSRTAAIQIPNHQGLDTRLPTPTSGYHYFTACALDTLNRHYGGLTIGEASQLAAFLRKKRIGENMIAPWMPIYNFAGNVLSVQYAGHDAIKELVESMGEPKGCRMYSNWILSQIRALWGAGGPRPGELQTRRGVATASRPRIARQAPRRQMVAATARRPQKLNELDSINLELEKMERGR